MRKWTLEQRKKFRETMAAKRAAKKAEKAAAVDKVQAAGAKRHYRDRAPERRATAKRLRAQGVLGSVRNLAKGRGPTQHEGVDDGLGKKPRVSRRVQEAARLGVQVDIEPLTPGLPPAFQGGDKLAELIENIPLVTLSLWRSDDDLRARLRMAAKGLQDALT